jgi:hypothetical protein
MNELIHIGFVRNESGWYSYTDKDFYIELCPPNNSKEGYFFIYTSMSSDRESAPHPYKGVDKLMILINAYKQFFK